LDLAAVETYICLTLSGFLAASGLLFSRKRKSVFEGAKVQTNLSHAKKM